MEREWQGTYKRNNEARSRNHCCRGKSKSVLSVCVCRLVYPACTAHAPYYIVICGLPRSTIFFHIISKMARSPPPPKKKVIERKMVVFILHQLLSETFFHSRRIQRDIFVNVHRCSCNVSIIALRFLRNFNFFNRFLKNIHISSVTEIRPVGAELFHSDGRTDRHGWTERHDEVHGRFSKFCVRASRVLSLWALYCASSVFPV